MFELIERELLPVNWLSKAEYCEYQLFLEQVQKIRVPFSRQMIQGSKMHASIEKDFLKEALPLKESIESYLKKLLKGKAEAIALREFELESKKLNLIGRIDEIHFFENNALIIENKPSKKVFPAQLIQLRAYCLMVKEKFDWKKELFASIQETASMNFVFLEKFSQKHEKTVLEKVKRLSDLFNAKKPFMPAENKNKCINCRFNAVCKYAGEKNFFDFI